MANIFQTGGVHAKYKQESVNFGISMLAVGPTQFYPYLEFIGLKKSSHSINFFEVAEI